jgi:3-dehydroquinate dehydratase I
VSRPLPANPIKLGNLTLGGPQPLICAPSAELSAIYRWAKLPLEQRPDLFEWRQDLSIVNLIFPSILKLIFSGMSPLPMPLIVTRRRQQEGGAAKDSQHRVNLLLACAEIASAIDIELESPGRDWLVAALPPQMPIIVSWHDFAATPSLDELKRIITRAAEMRGGRNVAIKFATMAHTAEDAATLLQAVEWARREGFDGPLIGIAMGAAGQHTRIEAIRYGSDLTFARVEAASAPGQMTLAEVRRGLAEALRSKASPW